MKTFIYGLRRSGNHGIISWILNNLNTGPGEMEWISKERIKTNHSDIVFLNDISMGPELCKNTKKPWRDIYESHFSLYPHIFLNVEESFIRPDQLGFKDDRVNFIFIFRDIFNLIASRLKKDSASPHFNKIKNTQASVNTYFAMYQQYEALKKECSKVTMINYNKWLTSPNYKGRLCRELNLPTCKDNKNISSVGPGSSFGDKEVNITALLSRYETVDNSLFLEALSPRHITITEKHFHGIDKKLNRQIARFKHEVSCKKN